MYSTSVLTHNTTEGDNMRIRRRNLSDVAIAHNENETLAINECLALLNADNLINPQDVVVITPNWVKQESAQSAVVVGDESLRTVIQYVKSKNPKRLIIATGSAEKDTKEIGDNTGLASIIVDEGVEFVDLNKGPFTRVNLNHDKPNATNLNALINEMTVLISFTQLKLHEEATMSASIKNIALGWPPAEEHGFPKKNLGIHEKLHGFITAMAEVVPIDLSIVSASPAMIGSGPSNGLPRNTGLVIAGTDPVSVDTIAARLVGFRPQAVQYLFECGNRGIGVSSVDSINMKGLSLQDAERIFSTAAYGNSIVIDQA